MPERCELTDLFKDQCVHCRPASKPEHEAPAYGPWVPARYPGRCGGCGSRVEQDDLIRSDGEGGWLAECCGDDDA